MTAHAPAEPGPARISDAELVVPTAQRTRRRRRPSGAPPPLPRQIGRTGRGWMVVTVVLVAWLLVALPSSWARRVTDQVDHALLRGIVELRTEWLTTAARGIDRMATGWTLSVVTMLLLVATVVCKRWRHLFTFLGCVVLLQIIGVLLIEAYGRPRPYEITIIGRWQGFSLPSATAALVSITVVGVLYMLVVPGRPRRIGKFVGAGVVLLTVGSRLYLGVDHPFDVLTGVTLGVAIPLVAFRFFTPNEVVPVTYRGGKTAHLDIGGRRGVALRRAVEDQLGVTVRRRPPDRSLRVGRIDAAAAAARRRSRHRRLREALRDEPRPRRPLVQVGPDHPLRTVGGRGAVPDGAATRPVRGLRAAADARRRDPDGRAPRHRRAHPRAGVHAAHRVLRRRRRDRRRRRRRPVDRRGPGDRAPHVARRDRPPGHQAGEPDGP